MKEDLVPGNLEWADDKKDKIVFVRGAEGNVNMYDGSKIDAAKLDELSQYSNDEYLMLNNGVTYPPAGPWHQKLDYSKIKKIYDHGFNITWFGNHMKFWFSIAKASKCLFSRRLGYSGKRIFGYSIRLRILSKEII
jgi:hypothetical protein